jgi:CRP/FNR family transcriptional regulator
MENVAAPIEATLACTPIFGAMDPAELKQFAAMAKRRNVARGELIFTEGSPCDAFFIAEKGKFRLFRTAADGRAHILHHISPGQSFAEAAVFGSGRYPASAESTENGTLVVVPSGQFLRYLRAKPALYERVIVSLTSWLHTLLDRVDELTAGSASGRLAHYLVRQPAVGENNGKVVIHLQIPKREIAARLSIAPETLSRVLHDWETQGIIISKPKGIEVLDVSRLEKIADHQH